MGDGHMAETDVYARIAQLERLAHWEDLETRIARLERLVAWVATVAGIAIAIGIGAAVGAFVQGEIQFQSWGWSAILASLAAIGLTAILLQRELVRLDG
jgi:predicted MFS family arabinose efflux permease